MFTFKIIEIKMNNGDVFYLFPKEEGEFTSIDLVGKYIGRGGNSLLELNTTKEFSGAKIYVNANNISSVKGLME